ncbi:hypothetical protein HHK36_031286 [Tetracentron sinense]|uniref:Uncharacterized protein n=1 Tax=Tetracentron sinense TaxID=13715 RepID=A0A834YAM5_TETSI|nr:hypothetical protein HHK36_031286 [Tetracentron sinense]
MEGKSHTVAASVVRPPDQTPEASNPFMAKFERHSPTELYSRAHKRMKIFNERKDTSSMARVASFRVESTHKEEKTPSKVMDYSDPFSVPNLLEGFDCGKYGSVTKEIEALRARKMQMLNPLYAMYPSLSHPFKDPAIHSSRAGLDSCDLPKGRSEEFPKLVNQHPRYLACQDFIDLEDDFVANNVPPAAVEYSVLLCKSSAEEMPHRSGQSSLCVPGVHGSIGQKKIPDVHSDNQKQCNMPVIVIDSDEEDGGDRFGTGYASSYKLELSNYEVSPGSKIQNPSYQYQGVVLRKTIVENPIRDLVVRDCGMSIVAKEEQRSPDGVTETHIKQGVFVGVQDDMEESNHQSDTGDDALVDIWKEMTFALECSKDAAVEGSAVEHSGEEEEEGEGEECDHSFVLKDDLGYVCRVCGVIERGIETIFDYQWIKGSRTTRTYMSESRSTKDREQSEAGLFSGLKVSEYDLSVAEISLHPRHMKQMKPHQLEGFNFLIRNLVSDNPGGCILAHAPGSGKTFMVISFVQSFLAKYPNARPLVVLPKGILSTWRKEFERWQVEDIPLYDFYSTKAENRPQQLDVLKKWVEHRSILFLGYKQFANIVCGTATNKITAACQEILLKAPSILILDEGHTPRNENTDVLNSLAKVQTPRKVVLSGTLYQNHVKEVFNILNLVRPRFLKLDSSRAVVRRVLSRVQIPGGRKQLKNGVDSVFFDMVEHTLQKDEDFKRKITVIRDLREMTNKVLHYYKGDFLEELPGLVDFTVLLNLSTKQKHTVEHLRKLEKFKRSSIGSALYMHPHLKHFSENTVLGEKGASVNDDKVDGLLEKIDVKDGVKTKFFLNILGLCESSGEKLLVFSQYLLPLKFLERLVVRKKGWSIGKEIFGISGDSNTETREWSMDRFNNSPDAKVLFGSIKACGEGISLVGASRILILDVHLNPSVTRQAIGRAFRPGQERKVYVYRLIAADSPEEEDHITCFRKELISKMWFEWHEYCGHDYFEMEMINVKECDDLFLESPLLGEDVKVLYKRLV